MENIFVNLNGIRKRAILNRFKEIKQTYCTVMEEITEEDEKYIDNHRTYNNKAGINIHKNDIILYGVVNLELDAELIGKRIDMNDERHVIYSNFNYELGGFYKDDKDVAREYETVNPLLWFKFNHCLIGKPTRIIVYNINKLYLND